MAHMAVFQAGYSLRVPLSDGCVSSQPQGMPQGMVCRCVGIGWPLGARDFLLDVCIDSVISDQMGWPLGAGGLFLFDVCIDGVTSDQMGWPLGARGNFFV